jgi:UDP-N-acetylmuramoyl-L-alanyl-D-glutamate--2,6-diaminopimelate ligase
MSHVAATRLRKMTLESTAVPARSLRALLVGVSATVPPNLWISDLTLDSRAVRSGTLFVALPGLRTHGIEFAAQAARQGAVAILWDPATANVPAPRLEVPLIEVPGLRSQLGVIADRFFNHPSRAIRVAAVTGTNGKTTTAYVVAAALAQLGRAAAYAGTLGHGRIEALQPGNFTTPDCITLHRQLAELQSQGVHDLGMEVSSHALDQQRVAGMRFDTAIFTNLTHDHLDYHGTLEAYGAAKAGLFEWPELQLAVINVDDAFGRELALRHGGELIVCSRSAATLAALPSHGRQRRLLALSERITALGLCIELDGSWGRATLQSRFVGDFNVDNLLAVAAVLLGWGVSLPRVLEALGACTAPPGRMQSFAVPGRPLAIVDYAHTPDALEKALRAARKHCTGRLTCVFGCGGDRDGAKRPVMGAIAERLADRVVITDDNPRTESGDAIVAAILAGLTRPEHARVERDRARAIAAALVEAGSDDAVLIAGKGHEDYQIIGTQRRPFNDAEVVRALLAEDRKPP